MDKNTRLFIVGWGAIYGGVMAGYGAGRLMGGAISEDEKRKFQMIQWGGIAAASILGIMISMSVKRIKK